MGYGICRFCEDEAPYQRQVVAVVLLETANHPTHSDQVKTAFATHKGVLVDKPLAGSMAAGRGGVSICPGRFGPRATALIRSLAGGSQRMSDCSERLRYRVPVAARF